ncbi:hypothetical protein [Waltera sp.]|uniref:hypothetical protein n=1 Tax=Waltera sp. TaxID=2815806 RepID=UPI0039A24D0D
MKDFHLKILAIIMIIFGIFGLSTLPFLSIIVQYIDSITGFSSGNGYLTNNMDYLLKVLLFILVAFLFLVSFWQLFIWFIVFLKQSGGDF